MRKPVALFLVCLPLPASAEVMHHSKCKTNDGETIADAQASDKQLTAAATCDSGAVYRSTD